MVASTLASAIGSSEAAVKLLLSIFIGYPLALLYRTKPIYTLSPLAKHIFFTVIGILLGYYNFGLGVLHSVANVTIVFLILFFTGGTKFSAIFVFVFNMIYLILGYYYQISKQYGISWTMPHCVLTLRLIAVAFDYYDGKKVEKEKQGEKVNDLQDTLQKCPSFLEMLGHTFYFGGYMVGPQFSMKRYLSFVNGEFTDKETGEAPKSVSAACQRLLVGFVYVTLYQSICIFLPDQYLNTSEFYNTKLLHKCALIFIWGKNSLHKYIGVWLMQEGVIILTGMSYNGLDEKGREKWDGCSNIRVKKLEFGHTFPEFIQSFNINTNQWMSKYIFKRLKFLGSKIVSQLITLFYLAIWHGLQSGYYMCFFLELVYTNAEHQLDKASQRIWDLGYIPEWKFLRPIHWTLRKSLLLFLWSFALLPFSLHDFDKWHPIYRSSNYIGFIIPIVGVPLCQVILKTVPRKHLSNGVSHSGDAKPKGDNTENNKKKEL